MPSNSSHPGIPWPTGHAPQDTPVFAQNVIEIAAPPDRVWQCLIEASQWPSWYLHCSDVTVFSADQRLALGVEFRWKTLGFYFRPKVVEFRTSKLLLWVAPGPLGSGGAHAWHLDELGPSRTRVTTEETQHGAFVRLLKFYAQPNLWKSHEAWVQALKQRAESEAPA